MLHVLFPCEHNIRNSRVSNFKDGVTALCNAVDWVFPEWSEHVDDRTCNVAAKTAILEGGVVNSGNLGTVLRLKEEVNGVQYKPKTKAVKLIIERNNKGCFVLMDPTDGMHGVMISVNPE